MNKESLNLKAIWYDAENDRFQFGHLTESVATIGARLARALIRDEDYMLFHGECRGGGSTETYPVKLSVNYVTEMLRFVATYDWFWDEVDWRSYLCDHEPDRDSITPGRFWTDVIGLRQAAMELEIRASALPAEVTWIRDELWSSAQQLREQAENLLGCCLPEYRW